MIQFLNEYFVLMLLYFVMFQVGLLTVLLQITEKLIPVVFAIPIVFYCLKSGKLNLSLWWQDSQFNQISNLRNVYTNGGSKFVLMISLVGIVVSSFYTTIILYAIGVTSEITYGNITNTLVDFTYGSLQPITTTTETNYTSIINATFLNQGVGIISEPTKTGIMLKQTATRAYAAECALASYNSMGVAYRITIAGVGVLGTGYFSGRNSSFYSNSIANVSFPTRVRMPMVLVTDILNMEEISVQFDNNNTIGNSITSYLISALPPFQYNTLTASTLLSLVPIRQWLH
jgi:hypothetical protein